MLSRTRTWLAVLGTLLALAVLLPPWETLARQYVFAEAVQYVVLATAVPALVVLGTPSRAARLARWAGRVPAAVVLASYIAVVIAWRLPFAVNALSAQPAWLAAEAVTLVGAGCALWLELVSAPRVSRWLRAFFGAVAMWSIWAAAYVLGFSGTAWYAMNARHDGRGLGVIADQEIATGLLWAISGLAYVPLVFVLIMTWLDERPEARTA
jgi:cytochrome c oxidase assembly factor CtaG